MVAREARAVPKYARHRGRTVLLVHGYNVRESEAAITLDRFRSLLGEFHAPLGQDTFTVAWPGKRPLGFADFPLTTRQAKLAALTLLDAIRDRCRTDETTELILVAHSLGCRVVLEAVQRLCRFPTRPRRLILVLMAAAVPVDMVRYPGRLCDAPGIVDRMAVLHSQSDWVLAAAFRLGETIGGEGRFPNAIGSRGEPFALEQRVNLAPAGHGDYWRSRKAASVVCEVSGVPSAAAALVNQLIVAPLLSLGDAAVAPQLAMT